MRISQVLGGKDDATVRTIEPGATVRDLVAALADANVGALVVSSDGATVEGIVSERDVVRRLGRDTSVLEASVESIMSREVETCRPEQAVDELMALMTRARIRHVPVVEDGRLTGIISIGDVVKSRIEELEFENSQLGSYLNG